MNRPMRVAVVSSSTDDKYYDLLNKKINDLIETSQCYLFYILCGNLEDGKPIPRTLGEIWALKNGAPILYISEKTTDKLTRRLFSEADYIFFLLDGNPFINKLFMKYKMTGKHGSAIEVK